MKSTFETKEQYLAFRSAWATAVNDPRSKSTLEPHDEYLCDASYNCHVSKGTGQHRVKGWMKTEHYIMFNILTGKKPNRGYTHGPENEESFAYKEAYANFKKICKYAFEASQPEKLPWSTVDADRRKSVTAHVSKFLAPFADTVSIEHLANINFANLETIGE